MTTQMAISVLASEWTCGMTNEAGWDSSHGECLEESRDREEDDWHSPLTFSSSRQSFEATASLVVRNQVSSLLLLTYASGYLAVVSEHGWGTATGMVGMKERC